MARFVAYLRVSTSRQAQSGLGLDAQRAAVESYVDQVGGDLAATYIEVESGASSERIELKKAIRVCRASKSMLVVAKLDRLARNVNFISALMESGIEFIAADMPGANRLTIHLISAIAEYEREIISKRTTEALSRAKAKGIRLGNPRVRDLQAQASAAASEKSNAFAKTLLPHLFVHDPAWSLSATSLAAVLNIEGIQGSRAGRWSAASVISLRKRLRSLGHLPQETAKNTNA